ncbi:MAG: hypothetical protein WAT92_08360 [Saprospiraceae bacterium]
MKNKFHFKCIIFQAQILVFMLVMFGSCTNEKIKVELEHVVLPEVKKEQFILSEENDGTYYSDSMMAALAAPIEDIKIDSFSDLHSFDVTKFQFENCNEITKGMLRALDVHGIHTGIKKNIKYPKVTKAQNKILGVTEHLCDKTFRKNFKMFVFHSSNIESHYSNSIHLFTISNTSNKYDQLELCVEYMRKGYEYDLSCRFLSESRVELKREERFNTSNSVIEDDSISITVFNYVINEKGQILELK